MKNQKGLPMNNLIQFKNQKYLNLETFRKNGEGIKTPVWFIEKNNTLFVTTEPQSGKVKRIRHNPQVRIAPCRMEGTVIGEWCNATAHLLQENEAVQIDKLFTRKYGLMKFFFDLPSVFRKKPERTFIAIELNPAD